MKKAERIEKPLNVEVIPVRIMPATVENLRTDVTALAKDAGDKQKVIDKLEANLAAQQQTSTSLEQRIVNLEGLSP